MYKQELCFLKKEQKHFRKKFLKKRKMFFFQKNKVLVDHVKQFFFCPKTIVFVKNQVSAKLSVFKNGH